jgi:hypothetical protein
MIARYAIPFFLLMGFVIVPMISFLLCRWLLPKRYGRQVGTALALLIVMLVGYGMTQGFSSLEVRQVEFVSSELPEAFDGYRIVQFTDAHVGTMTGSRAELLRRLVDTIRRQHADAIVFTGDLQNIQPDELTAAKGMLSQLHAPDGVFTILGNHDYAVYVDADEKSKEENCRRTREQEEQMGWTLLLNDHRIIRRGSDSIVMAGMENWGTKKRMPRRGDVKKTLAGISPESFVVMLQHDPSCWREKILPECKAQLTLSGHTHGGQFSLFGWSPAALSYDEWNGMTYEGRRALYVSAGAGALIPFRLGMPREIVVITLKVRK